MVALIFATVRLNIYEPLKMRRDVFQAIADPVRRDIIDILSQNECTVNDIADNFEISRQAISKHIKILQECGLIEINQDGRERYCQIQPKSLIPAFLWIDQYHKMWEEKIDDFEQYVNELNKKNKKK